MSGRASGSASVSDRCSQGNSTVIRASRASSQFTFRTTPRGLPIILPIFRIGENRGSEGLSNLLEATEAGRRDRSPASSEPVR